MMMNFLFPILLSILAGLFVLLSPDFFGLDSLATFLVYTFLASFVLCLIIARIWPVKWWLWPLVFLIAYPTKVGVEILLNPTAHNLWPIEILFCLPYAITGLLGAYLGQRHSPKSAQVLRKPRRQTS